MVKPVELKKVALSEPQVDVMMARTAIIADMAGQGSGKTMVIGLDVGQWVINFPEVKGFIGANTYEQLSSSTLSRVFMELEDKYGLIEYDKKDAPDGHYVVGKKPPLGIGWKKPKYKFKNYNNVMTFWNGCTVFLGSLDNYKSHEGKEFGWAHLDETKDTKKEALTNVIIARLRQYGLWVYKATGKVLWNPIIKKEKAEELGLQSWNPLYIHTSPAEGNVDWLIDVLGIGPYAQEIKTAISDPYKYYFKVLNGATVVIYSTYWNEDNLPPGYIKTRKDTLTQAEFLKFVLGYPFAKTGGEWYPHFDRLKTVQPCVYKKELPIFQAWDFNARPYVTLLCVQMEYVERWFNKDEFKKYDEPGEGRERIDVLQIRVFKEYTMEAPNNTTDHTCDAFATDFEHNHPEVYAYGDASGRSRIEGFGDLTNYKLIEAALRGRVYLPDVWLRAKKVNLGVAKRRDLMNKIFEDKIPGVELYIDPECLLTIKDCEYVLQGKDEGKHKEMIKDKNGIEYQALGHTSDALEYIVCEVCKEHIKEY